MQIEDVITHSKKRFLVKPKYLECLVEATDFLYNLPAEARAMGGLARKIVFENYTWAKNAKKEIEVYLEVQNAF